jgi:hypothetical protein
LRHPADHGGADEDPGVGERGGTGDERRSAGAVVACVADGAEDQWDKDRRAEVQYREPGGRSGDLAA